LVHLFEDTKYVNILPLWIALRALFWAPSCLDNR
jgi:hypothetical protein